MTPCEKVVLVIDDDSDFQTILRVTLNQNGYYVRSLMNGRIDPTIHELPMPDLILLDVDLPYANGVEVGKVDIQQNQVRHGQFMYHRVDPSVHKRSHVI